MLKQKKRQRKSALIALSFAMFFVVGMVSLVAPWRAGQYDEATFCRTDGQYARTIILIDATDSLSEAQIKTVTEEIIDLRGSLSPSEWVGVFVLDESDTVLPAAATALCNPGDKANPLYQNPEEIRRRYEQRFVMPMRQAVAALFNRPPQKNSPILEMIRAVALVSEFNSSQPRRLIIVSDMLQNVAAYSHYRDGTDFLRWQKSDYAADFLRLSLTGVEVSVWYVKRPEVRHLQTHGHANFWHQFFTAAGADLAVLRPL